jgi:hypothetical protein
MPMQIELQSEVSPLVVLTLLPEVQIQPYRKATISFEIKNGFPSEVGPNETWALESALKAPIFPSFFTGSDDMTLPILSTRLETAMERCERIKLPEEAMKQK